MSEPLKIELGKFYRDGFNRKWEIVKVLNGPDYGCLGLNVLALATVRWFKLTGEAPEGNHEFNARLISEWIDAPAVDWSKMANWHNWVAMDQDGGWHVYYSKPEIHVGAWYFSSRDSLSGGKIPKELCPKFSGGWRDSLVCRPGIEVKD